VWITGRQGLTEREAASLLIYDARSFLQKELGLAEAKWDNQDGDTSSYDSQSLPEQVIHSSQQQSPLQDKTSKHPEQTANKLSISCHLKEYPLLLEEEFQSKISLSETSKRLTKLERKNSLHCSLQGNQTPDLKDGIDKTESKCLSSEVSDKDYVSSSPSLNDSQDRSSQRHTKRKLRSKLGKARNSKIISGSILQNTSAKRNTGKSTKNILSKISETVASKPYKAVPIVTNQFQCNKMDITHCGKVKCSSSEEIKDEQNLLSFSSMLHKTLDDSLPGDHAGSNRSSSEVNQSIDYFGSPFEISESKLHEETQDFKQNNKPKVKHEPSPENVSGKEAGTSDVANNKVICPRTFVSSLRITDNVMNKSSETFTDICSTDTCLSNNQETGLLRNDAVEVDQNSNPSLGPACEKFEEKERVILTNTDKRRSADFFSSPVSAGNCAPNNGGDVQSPSLFGDSLVMDTQLNNMLDACYSEHKKTAEGDCQNEAQDCNKKLSANLTQQRVPLVYSNDIMFSKDGCESGTECHETEEESNNIGSSMSSPEILNITELDIKNIRVGEVNDKMKENSQFKKVNQLHSLSKGFISAREVMKWEKTKSEISDRTINSATYNSEMEDLEVLAASNVVGDSTGKKGIILHLSSCSTDNEVLGPHSVYSEEIDFCSVDDETAISLVKPNFKTKRGLLSPVTYNLNEKLHRSNRTLKETLRRKRKTSTSSDSSYSEHEFVNRKRKRIFSGCKLAADEDEINCGDTVCSVLKENDIAEHWLDAKNKSTSETNKNFPPKGQQHERFPNENQGVIHVTEQNLYTEKQMVRGRSNPEGDIHITDSFLKTAFDTHWDLDTEAAKSKKRGELQHDLGAEEVGINTSKTSPLEELNVLIPPSVFNITQTSNKPKTENEVVSADSASPSQRVGVKTKERNKVDQASFVISNSFLEAAFNTCWEENPEYKQVKTEEVKEKQNIGNDDRCNTSLKDDDTPNILRHQQLSSGNRRSEGQLSSKGKKKSGCGRRRSPRLMAAATDEENRNSYEKSTEVCKAV
jgi:hypothetical protein